MLNFAKNIMYYVLKSFSITLGAVLNIGAIWSSKKVRISTLTK